jgi:nicotinate-nucleotide adenylyltransferase
LTAHAQAGPVAVLGGTFNPVHFGHLRSAVELVEHLGLAQLRLMPAAVPPHRELPGCSAEHRAAMVELAIRGESRLLCDRRELARSGPSYSIDSLIELRAELGADTPVLLVIGCDALLGLADWHRWRELLDYAHIVVLARPGWQLPEAGELGAWLARHRAADQCPLREAPSGCVHVEALRPLDISATEIRALLQSGKSVRYLLPEPVLDYIATHGLYRQGETHRHD